MFDNANYLYFPELKREPYTINEKKAYMLAWGEHDRILTKSGFKFPDYMVEFFNKYEWVNNIIYEIPDTYLFEIRRLCHTANYEWGIRRAGDTYLSELCIAPVNIYITSIFKYLMDLRTSQFRNDFNDRIPVATAVLIYHFWYRQTGGGNLMHNSGINKFETYPDGSLEKKLFNDVMSLERKELNSLRKF